MQGFYVSAEILQFGRMEDAPNRVRELRMAKGLSQASLGEAIGVHKMTVSDIERGQIELTLSYMRKLSRALEVEIDELFAKEDHPGRMTDEERELISAFRQSQDAARSFLLASARAVSQRDEAA